MNKIKNKKTNFFFFTGVVSVLFFAYLFIVSAESSSQLISINSDSSAREVGKDTLETLLELKSLRLDGSLFEDQVFLSLQDFSVELKDQPKGRLNPFAILGSDQDYVVPVSEEEDDAEEIVE